MNKHTILAAAAISILGLTSSAWAQQTLIAADSEIRFTFTQLGVPVTGHFKTFSADVTLDPKALDASQVTLNVDTSSATLGDPQIDAEMAKQPWFNTAQFPTATFESSAIKQTAEGQYEATGTLTIKGERSEVTIPVTLAPAGAHTVATGTLPIQRLDFKIGEGEWSDTSMVANDVQVNFKLTLDGVEGL